MGLDTVLCFLFQKKKFKSIFFILDNLSQTLFFNPYVFAIWCRRPRTFQTMNSTRSYRQSSIYKKTTPSGYKDIKFEFEVITEVSFLFKINFQTTSSSIFVNQFV